MVVNRNFQGSTYQRMQKETEIYYTFAEDVCQRGGEARSL